MKTLNIFAILGMLILLTSFASAMVVDSVTSENLYPGQSADLKVSVKNTLNEDVDDVSLTLNLENTKFTTVGSSEDSEDTIDEDDSENFNFVLKAAADTSPGDYNIPYSLVWVGQNGTEATKSGTFGISVGAKTELSFSAESENNIVGHKGKVSVKIINSGLGDIGFVNVKIASASGLEILGTGEEYIGSVRSDDFELATMDALFKSTTASLTAIITYKDFDNAEHLETITLPVGVYSQEKALELGLISKSNTGLYVVIAIILLGIWYIWRRIKKARKRRERAGE